MVPELPITAADDASLLRLEEQGWTRVEASHILSLIFSANAWLERNHAFPKNAARTLTLHLRVRLPLSDFGDFDLSVDAEVEPGPRPQRMLS